MGLAAPGIGSNLDVNSIVTQLINVESRPLTLLNQREAGVQAKITAFGTVRGALSSFQSSVRALSDAARFSSFKASSSDTTVASISATTKANAANYSLEVTNLAQAQKLVSTGQASSTTAIGSGTVTIDFGTISGGSFNSGTGKYTGASFASNGSGSKTIAIDNSNNSLEGIRDAINRANAGVTASIVNDGDENAPYRLVLSVNGTGASNSLKISVSGDTALSDVLAYNPAGTQNLQQTATAQNANFKLDGVSISKSSNTVTDVISGASFTLLKEGTSNFSVTRDTQAVQAAVQSFVKAYNDIDKTLSDISAYNASTGRGAILQGDSTVRSIQNRIRGVLNHALTGVSGEYATLSSIGVSFQSDGSLALDATKLQAAINNDFSGIADLFAVAGRPSDSLVQYQTSTSNTLPGVYDVNVSQLATQGQSLGSVDVSGGVTLDSSNNTLGIKIDGITTIVTLSEGTYTAEDLAKEVQAQLNGAGVFANSGVSVAVELSGNALRITSDRYGSFSNVSVTGGTAQATIFGAGTDSVGVDAAGTIGGLAATGSGQTLTGAGPAAGLRLSITGGSTGGRGSVNFSQGFAYQLDKLTDGFIGTGGLVRSRTDGLNQNVTEIGKRRDALNTRLADLEVRLRAQYTALDGLIGRLSATQTYLSQQLANLPGFTSNNR